MRLSANGRGCLWKSYVYGMKAIRLSAVFLFATLFIFSFRASGREFRQGTITLSMKSAPLNKIFAAIQKQTKFTFIYERETLRKARPVDIDVTNASLETVLEICFKGQPLSYVLDNESVVVRGKETSMSQGLTGAPEIVSNLINVRGRVVNENGEAVPEVTVAIKFTNIFTRTDLEGEFVLSSIDPQATLVFSHVSMDTFEVNVSGQPYLNISLKTKRVVLGEVTISVNTGYQKISQERFVGAVSTMDSAAYHRRAGLDIVSRLDGTVTGLFFDKKSGRGLLNSIQVRGISTLDGNKSPNNAPLIVVDNFPFREDINLINPNDIESISVLKDAAAASVWGAQAGNGVIVITTKKGNYNQPLRFSFGYNMTVQEKPDLYYYPQIAVADFVDAETFLFNNGRYDADLSNTNSWPVISPVVELLARRRSGKISAEDSALQINGLKSMDMRRDLDKYLYRPAVLQQYYTNVRGGSNILNYNLSVGYNRSINNISYSKPDDQITINSNAAFKPFKNFEVTAGINYNQSNSRSTNFSLPEKVYPYAQLADAEGNALAIPNERRVAYLDSVGGGNLLDWKYRPLAELGLADRSDEVRLAQFATTLSYRITPWLTALASYRYMNQSTDSKNNNSLNSFFTRSLINEFTNLSQSNVNLRYPIPLGDIMDVANIHSITQNMRAQLNFSKAFGSVHQLSALVAAELLENKTTGSRNRFYGYDKNTGAYNAAIDYTTNFPQYGNATQLFRIPNENVLIPSRVMRVVSFLGNLSYTYDSRYTIYASARRDGSNAFGVNTNRKWNPLWSAGFSWDITKESFFRETWLSALRFRTSYGFTGNMGNATGLPTIRYVTTPALYTNLTSAHISDPPNPDLRWEKVKIVNVALEFGLFKNRVSGKIDVFSKKATDVISGIGLAPSTGVTGMTVNYANLAGKGFEFNLVSKNLTGKVEWLTSFGLSYAKMKVTKLFQVLTRASDFISYGLNASEGRIAYGLSSYRWNGLDPLTGDPRGFYNKQVSTNYLAIFNDSANNQVFHGSAIPLYQGFIGNSISWKNFVLSANITYRLDFYYRKPSIDYSRLINTWAGHADYANRWQKPGDEKLTNVPSFTYPSNQNRDLFYTYSEVNVLRGDNIRWQDIRLQYTWRNAILKRNSGTNLQLFVYVNNLNVILWRKDKSDLDPDFVGGNGFLAPTPKTYTVGFTLNL